MTKKVLCWGLLTTARINSTLIPAIRAARGACLLAVASRDEPSARSYAATWEIPRAYGSYDQLLADPEIDIIYNPLPNHLHAPFTIRAAEHGKHVLCEKPLALTPQEVDAILAASQANRVAVAEAFMYRHHAQTLRVQELVASGQLGEIRHMNGTFSFILDRPEDYRWRPEAGGGSLWDIGCYPLSYMRMLMGANPVEIYGQADWAPTGIDHSFNALLTYPGGATGHVFCSFGLPYAVRIEIFGTRGSLVSTSPFRPRRGHAFTWIQGDSHQRLPNPLPSQSAVGEVENLMQVIRSGAAPRLSLEESRDNILTISALLDSARQGVSLQLA